MILFDIKKFSVITSIVLLLISIVMMSISYLFADEIDEIIVQRKEIGGEINSLQGILIENSIYDDLLYKSGGLGSHYGKKFHNRKTASGVRYNMNEYTAAHRKLPFGTILKVTNTSNNKSTFVKINDRGPFVRKRIIDLSKKSALAIDGLGLPDVKIEGFIPGSVELPYENDKDYFFAYSYNYQPLIIPTSFLMIKSTFFDFDTVVETYDVAIKNGEINPNESFIVFKDDNFDLNNENRGEVYHIAVWKPISFPKIPVMMAEKVYPNK